MGVLKNIEWKTDANTRYHGYDVKDNVWQKEAGLDFLGGNPTLPEFEEYLGRELTVEDMSPAIYNPDDSIVADKFGRNAIKELADKYMEENFIDGKLDVIAHSKLVMEGVSRELQYVKWFPDGKYASEINEQLKDKELIRNGYGFYEIKNVPTRMK